VVRGSFTRSQIPEVPAMLEYIGDLVSEPSASPELRAALYQVAAGFQEWSFSPTLRMTREERRPPSRSRTTRAEHAKSSHSSSSRTRRSDLERVRSISRRPAVYRAAVHCRHEDVR
jgi:hypothetical protein